MQTENKNKLFYYIAHAMRTTAALCAGGTLMQTFLATLGFSADQLYIHSSIYQAVNVATILLCANFADTKSIIRRVALIQIPSAILYLSCIPFCLVANASFSTYVLLLLIVALHAIVTGLNTVCEYKLPYIIFRPESYGVVLSVAGFVSSLLSLGVGALVSWLSAYFAYTQIMLFGFALSGVFLIVAAALHFFCRALPESESGTCLEKSATRVPLPTVFRHPAFLHLLPANILRGFANGTVAGLAIIAIRLGFHEGVTAAMVSVQSAANLIGCILFSLIVRRLHPRYMIAIGSLFYLCLPLLLIPNAGVFLAVFGLVQFGTLLVSNAVPAGLRYIVPAEITGPYNAWRMVIHNGTILLSTAVAIFLPVPVLFAVTMIAQLSSGAFFLFLGVMRGGKRENITITDKEKTIHEAANGIR